MRSVGSEKISRSWNRKVSYKKETQRSKKVDSQAGWGNQNLCTWCGTHTYLPALPTSSRTNQASWGRKDAVRAAAPGSNPLFSGVSPQCYFRRYSSSKFSWRDVAQINTIQVCLKPRLVLSRRDHLLICSARESIVINQINSEVVKVQ